MTSTHLPRAVVTNAARARQHELRELRASRHARAWWNDTDPPMRDNGGTGCAVSLIVLTLFGYLIAGALLLF